MCLTSVIRYIHQTFKTDATMSFVSGTVSERPTGSMAGGFASTTVTLGEHRTGSNPSRQEKYTSKGQFLGFAVVWFYQNNKEGSQMVNYTHLGFKEYRSLTTPPQLSAEEEYL